MVSAVRAGNDPLASMFNIGMARYGATDTTTQINGNTTTILQWPTALTTNAYVTASGTNNQQFTLNVSGVWMIEFSTRCFSVTGATIGDIYGFGRFASSAVEFCGQTIQAPLINAPKPQGMTLRNFNAGDKVEFCLNNQVDATIQLQCASEREHVSFVWLQGLQGP